jgi:hypothetical protein
MLPLLIPIITQLAPSLIDWLFGSKAAATTTAVVDAVKAATGADPTTAEGVAVIHEMILDKPDVALDLQSKLLTIRAQMQAEADREADNQRAADMASLQASLIDTQSARTQMLGLAASHSALAWGSVVVSVVIVVAFGIATFSVFSGRISDSAAGFGSVLVGTLAAMATQVANYWLGSSSGSRGKDLSLAASIPASSVVVTKAVVTAATK